MFEKRNRIPITQILKELKTVYPNAKIFAGDEVLIRFDDIYTVIVNDESLYITSNNCGKNHLSIFFDYDTTLKEIVEKTISLISVVQDIIKRVPKQIIFK